MILVILNINKIVLLPSSSSSSELTDKSLDNERSDFGLCWTILWKWNVTIELGGAFESFSRFNTKKNNNKYIILMLIINIYY